MSTRIARRFVVSGKVQGVYFRASTQHQASQLGICGYAKNLATGDVEVLAIGTIESLKALEGWLWQGPTTARVTQVIVSDVVDEIEGVTWFATL